MLCLACSLLIPPSSRRADTKDAFDRKEMARHPVFLLSLHHVWKLASVFHNKPLKTLCLSLWPHNQWNRI